MTTKTCARCGIEKELELFCAGKNYKDGRRGTCKKCHAEYQTQYYKDRPEKYAIKVATNSYYKANWKRHKISEEAYQALVGLYDGKCHSCQDRVGTNLDHDHGCCSKRFSCGKCVRGLLCSQCNTALGLLQDNAQKIQKLLEYIS